MTSSQAIAGLSRRSRSVLTGIGNLQPAVLDVDQICLRPDPHAFGASHIPVANRAAYRANRVRMGAPALAENKGPELPFDGLETLNGGLSRPPTPRVHRLLPP